MKAIIVISVICLFVGKGDIQRENSITGRCTELALLAYELGYARGQNDMLQNYLDNNIIFYTDSLFKQGYENYSRSIK